MRHRRRYFIESEPTRAQCQIQFHNNGDGHRPAQWQITRKALAQRREIDVQHHHHEQEQHHHRANIDQHQRDGQELGLQQYPQSRAGEERQYQEHRGMHRIARRDHAQPGEH